MREPAPQIGARTRLDGAVVQTVGVQHVRREQVPAGGCVLRHDIGEQRGVIDERVRQGVQREQLLGVKPLPAGQVERGAAKSDARQVETSQAGGGVAVGGQHHGRAAQLAVRRPHTEYLSTFVTHELQDGRIQTDRARRQVRGQRFGQCPHAPGRQGRAPAHQHLEVKEPDCRGRREIAAQPNARQERPKERLDQLVRKAERPQLLLGGATRYPARPVHRPSARPRG